MKRMIGLVLCGLLLMSFASAAAMNEYTLAPFPFDEQAMLSLTFGEQADQAVADDRDYLFYNLPDYDGAPFCGLDDTAGFGQMRLTVYTALVATESHEPYIYENVEPSGIAGCALTAQEAQDKASAWLAQLNAGEMYLQSVTAYGKIEAYSDGYMVAFGQQLDGVPVYWAAALHPDDMAAYPESNRLEVCIGNSGLAMISGHWSAFTPEKQGVQVITEEEAVAAFAALGVDAASAELCYLLTGSQETAKAVPAYRFQNRFVSAENGTVLQ